EPPRSGPRSGRQPVRRLSERDPALVEDRHPGGKRHHRSAHVRRLLHAEHRLRLATHQHDRQSDRHLFPRRAAALRRCGAHPHSLPLSWGPDGLLYVHGRQGAARGAGVSEAALQLRATGAERSSLRRFRDWLANPWGKPRFLVLVTWLYVLVSILPVIIA